MRTPSVLCAALLVIVPILSPTIVSGQATKQSIEKAIESKYAVSKPTADHKDIVTGGAVIDLTKDNLLMYGTDAPVT